MAIDIMNLRNDTPSKPYDFCIDRRSPLGNPFQMKGESAREEVCKLYMSWFNEHSKHTPKVIAELNLLLRTYAKYGKLRLFCWCAPKQCHGETIKKWLLRHREYKTGV